MGPPDYFDRDGKPITREAWGVLASQQTYKSLAVDRIGSHVVSTVWLGLNHRFGDGPPLIFETMVFPDSAWDGDGDLIELDTRRYSTEEAALLGHADVVESLGLR